MNLPEPRGQLSGQLVRALRDGAPVTGTTTSGEEDLQLSLWVLYELHYRGFDEVDDRREWDPALIALRVGLEEQFEADLRAACAPVVALAGDSDWVPTQLEAITAYDNGTSLPRFLQREATTDQYLEFLVQRSIYHLKESDPHAFVVPRLGGAAKVALAELQYDEFGGGRPEALHAQLYADALEESGLDPTYGAYIDRVPAYALAVNNAMSLFGLHRRLRGAAMGHLAAFEMTSSLPCRRYLQGAERLGLPEAVRHYFDEHIEADAVHEHIAARDICGSLVDAEPHLREDILFGAAACVHLDAVAGEKMIEAWMHDGSTLLPELGREVA
jgi:hypothetical protein